MKKIFNYVTLFSIFISALPAYATENNIGANAKLIFAADIIRHGARTATKYLPGINYPSLWNQKDIPAGQLTQYGFNMEMQNGYFFKKVYSSILSNTYNPKNVCFVADGSNRDIMSTLAVITAMYPNISSADVIDVIPEERDSMLEMTKDTSAIENASGWLKKWHNIHPLIKKLISNKYISEEDYCNDLQTAREAFSCLQPVVSFSGQVVPLKNYCDNTGCSVKDTFPKLNNNDIQQLIELHDFYAYHSAIPSNDEGFEGLNKDYLKDAINSNGAVVISQIIYNMQQIINSGVNNNDHPKFILYAGHDTGIKYNIGYLLSKVNSTQNILTNNPKYGAALSFKLYKDNSKYYISVTFRQSHDSTNEKTIYSGTFSNFKNIYFDQEQLNKQQYKNCGSFQLK